MVHNNPTSPPHFLFRYTPTPSQQETDDDTTKAIKRALSDNDIQTIFFVNLLSDHDDKATLSNLNASRCMLTTEVEKDIYDKVQRNDLTIGYLTIRRIRTGHASRATVPTKTAPSDDKVYHQTKTCLYQDIRKHLMASSLSHGTYTKLDLIAKTIAEKTVLSGDSSPPHRKRFGVLFTWPEGGGPLSPRVLRYHQFEFDPVGLYLRYSLYVAEFVEDNFEGVRKGSGFELGQDLTNQRSMDVYLPCP
ncbi:uncharacterized protein BO88DRAFT_486959 [Aspergillus vadensis CBS 113365]|uniref:Uncharacterized protein n=1 Tax=Aspergillus vadensis (strain CBS 113365 / IMI 142717 / IBT 24658) TaxID=1448311 RepID=A0A319BDS9_ASPVC|nr:hypothetical protein BO88DRAFT_486959 [Aspergillus vadensis CBS 113365]PYH70154.1 hypothetical protein BO88DRAFT_486959 [Aspergillus vadensis CBS 113365]